MRSIETPVRQNSGSEIPTREKPAAFQHLPELLRYRATLHPQRPAAVFLEDDGASTTFSYDDLWRQSFAVAAELSRLDTGGRVAEAPRVVLLQPPGLSFLPAFFGAQIAGWIPVPTAYPKPHRAMPRIDAVVRDCKPAAILTTQKTLASIDPSRLDHATSRLPMIAVDALPVDSLNAGSNQTAVADAYSIDSIALLQYTSGSTSDPKGVIVTQRNVLANIASISDGFLIGHDHTSGTDAPVSASWLPFFHDMGLMAGVLAPIYSGFQSVFMSPQAFVRRPIQWLQMISDHGAIISGAPNFAYELCADRIAPGQMTTLDLSRWRLAFCGAEPIRHRTLHAFAQRFSSVGFSPSSYYPCYGLAESTLLAAGGDGPAEPRTIDVDRAGLRDNRVDSVAMKSKRDAVTIVSSGRAPRGTSIKIVDPVTSCECDDRRIGEIWLSGDSITLGYWHRPDENDRLFGTLAGKAGRPPMNPVVRTRWFRSRVPDVPATNGQAYLRTGDLGFIENGELFVTGRMKDVVIVRGRNYSPADIEATVGGLVVPGMDRAVAFSVDGPRAEGLGLVVELPRDVSGLCLETIVRDIRRAVIDEHEIDPRLVLLAKPGAIPMTTSGKVQRAACRDSVEHGRIAWRHRWERSGGTESPPIPIPQLPPTPTIDDLGTIQSQVAQWLRSWIITRVGIDPADVEDQLRFDDFGLDSLTAVELSGELEDWSGVELNPSNAWQTPTIESMAKFVAQTLVGSSTCEIDRSLPVVS